MIEVWAETALIGDGWADDVLIEIGDDGRIASVAAGRPPRGYRTHILLPAPVNVHSHAFQRAMAGLTESRGPDATDSFWTWRRLMYRFLDRLTPDHVEAIASFVQMEMLEAGYAACVEFHYLHHRPGGEPYEDLSEMSQRIVAAAARTGIGLTLLPVFYQFGGCDGRPLGDGQLRFGNDFDRFARLYLGAEKSLNALPPDCRLGVAPHSLRAVSPQGFASCVELAEERPVHMHLAEQQGEVDEVVAVLGERPVEWVLENLHPDHRFCFVHCTQMLAHETTKLARTGAIAGLCPITESSLGDGIFDGVRWLDAGGAIAVGSDSNIRISLSEELRTLEYSQRLRDRSRAVFATTTKSAGRRMFDAINSGGAVAAGRESGEIAPGKLADLVALGWANATLTGRRGDAILDSFVFAGDDRLVSDVWSAGRHVVREGIHPGHEAITARYLQTIAGIGATL
jgi:formimidoylglutamate deiminase